MDCHIEIFHENRWLEAAQASFSDVVRNGFRASDCVFEYDLDFAFGQAPPPVSLALPVDADRHVLQAWPAFVYDLVPQGSGRRYSISNGMSSAMGSLSMAWTFTNCWRARPNFTKR